MARIEKFAHCLIVDDSSVIRKVAARILSERSERFSDAASGAKALAICADQMPDLIILDADLPDMSMMDIISAIRGMPKGKLPRIIICLFEVDLPRIMRAKRVGADGHLLKPFDRNYLEQQFSDWSSVA